MAEQFHFVLWGLLHEAAQIVKNQFSDSGGSIFTVMFTDEGMEKQSARSEYGMKMNGSVCR